MTPYGMPISGAVPQRATGRASVGAGLWHQSAIMDGMTPIGAGGAPGEAIFLRLDPGGSGNYCALKPMPAPGWRRWMTPVQMEVTTLGLGKVAPDQAAVQRLWDALNPVDAGEQGPAEGAKTPGIPRFWRDAEIVLSLTPPGEPKQRLYQADWYLRTPGERAADEPDVCIYLDPYWLWGDGKLASALDAETLNRLMARYGSGANGGAGGGAGGDAAYWADRKKGLMWMPEDYWRAELELTLEHERCESQCALDLALADALQRGVTGITPEALVRMSVEWEGPAHAQTIREVDGFQDQASEDGETVPAERAYYRDCKRKLIEQGFGDDRSIKNWVV